MDKSKELGREKIYKLLLKFFIPAIIGTLVNALYNIVDRIYIGQGVGSLALAALSVAFPIMVITSGFGMLIGMGGGVITSISLGKKDKEKAEKILGNTFSLLCIISLLVSILALIIKNPILKSFGASENTIIYANSYLSIILFGTIFQNVGYGMNNIIRSEGNAKIAMFTMIIGAIFNIILDPIFIFIFHMGVKGAAIATVLSQIANTFWVLRHFTGKNSFLKLKRKNLKLDLEIFKSIIAIGMAPFSIQVAASLVNIVFNKELMIYGGDLAVGAMGIINSITMLIIMSIISVTQASQPIVGYNYGSMQFDRVKETIKVAAIGATIIALIGFIGVEFFPKYLIGIFNRKDEELLRIGVSGIRINLFALPIIGFQIVGSNYFQAVGKAKVAIVLSLLRQVIVLIPLLIILPKIFNLNINGVWLACPISDIISFIITTICVIKGMRDLDKQVIKNSEVSL
ncbi:multidrug transporter MatE [Clostridium novyi B str. ATCC 27606]|uniref:Multidrug export protein MepA n=2 Tax=Clostridium TaxID=1485 RepID=A0AA40IS03_CLONO|nr:MULTISPECIES: MATE family efflux transporter [Clostridium]KEI12258.1 multidrug transporter MatE [Clostridium novyi B str. ATCC 27606]KEI12489.1 multidrug transporter MatE [Clostridium novyi B str. NCTC 9691]KEI17941.1 multidrug transporter MatE [Clostridium haemolyticum NCTC 9693]KGN01574.1 multidrug transporter MatE [Clostridium haemolyticum NCTC 8350]CAG7839727.1 Multidrug export protein MepA [Clostridium haemolyticum]